MGSKWKGQKEFLDFKPFGKTVLVATFLANPLRK